MITFTPQCACPPAQSPDKFTSLWVKQDLLCSPQHCRGSASQLSTQGHHLPILWRSKVPPTHRHHLTPGLRTASILMPLTIWGAPSLPLSTLLVSHQRGLSQHSQRQSQQAACLLSLVLLAHRLLWLFTTGLQDQGRGFVSFRVSVSVPKIVPFSGA